MVNSAQRISNTTQTRRAPELSLASKMMKTISSLADKAACRLFSEVEDHLLREDAPSSELIKMRETPEFSKYPFSMLKLLEDTKQSPIHHPEGNVWKHTLLVVDEAAKRKHESSDAKAFMWAALLHDIGKPTTTKVRKGRITAYDHDKVGAQLTREFLSALTEDTKFIEKVAQLVRYHMQVLYVINNLPFKDIRGMKRDSDIREIALLCLCDRLGRDGADRESEEKQVQRFVDLCEFA